MDKGIRFDLAYETMPWHKVDTVVFDIGNVLVRFEPERLAAALFSGDEAVQRHMLEKVFYGPEWQELDRGTLTYESAADVLHAKYGMPREDYLRTVRTSVELKDPIEESWRAAARCKRAGKRLYILSNYAREGYDILRARFADRFAIFDGDCVSSHYLLLKPEPEIYRMLIDKFGLEPNRTLFIDDNLANVEAANRAGIHSFHRHEDGMMDRFFL